MVLKFASLAAIICLHVVTCNVGISLKSISGGHWIQQESRPKTVLDQASHKYYIGVDGDGKANKNLLVDTVLGKPHGDGSDNVTACFVYGDKNMVEILLEKMEKSKLKPITVSLADMELLKMRCDLLNDMEDEDGEDWTVTDEASGFDLLGALAIFPGTKWCGSGNIANNYDDLGFEKRTDVCCREHDHCSDNIAAGGTKYDLKNTEIYTKSNCDCDAKFQKCLKEVDSHISNKVGRTYFNLLQVQCFKNEYPIVKCQRYKGFALNLIHASCQEYKLDRKSPMRYQFFDAVFYDGGKYKPFIDIPIISGIITKPIQDLKDMILNGGILGSIIG